MTTMKYMPKKQIDNRGVKRTVDKRGALQFAILLFFVLIMAAGMIFFGWVRWKQREIVFRINKAEADISVIEEENKQLKAELEKLKAPGRISRIAREELGMIQPGADDYIIVDSPDHDEETR